MTNFFKKRYFAHYLISFWIASFFLTSCTSQSIDNVKKEKTIYADNDRHYIDESIIVDKKSLDQIKEIIELENNHNMSAQLQPIQINPNKISSPKKVKVKLSIGIKNPESVQRIMIQESASKLSGSNWSYRSSVNKKRHHRLYSMNELEKSTTTYEIDKILGNLKTGAIAFNVPEKININDSPQIHLILDLTKTVEELKRLINGKGVKQGANIRVSQRMEARLSGYKFEITAITSERQAISENEKTEWKWEVLPKEGGNHKLHLTLTALFDINGHDTPRAIRTFDKIIFVEVSTAQKINKFFESNWQWLWVTFLIPIGGWLWKQKKK